MKGEFIIMIDSSKTMTLYDVIDKFRIYIIQNYGDDSQTAQDYLRIADGFQKFVSQNSDIPLWETAIREYYELTVGVPAFEPPLSKTTERYARVIQMLLDISNKKEPKRKYAYRQLKCPSSYKEILIDYETMMADSQKSEGTIRTHSGRIKVFFIFLTGKGCNTLEDITPELFIDFISLLKEKYSSQGQASILYTIRNFFSYAKYSEKLLFDPLPFLTGIHSKKHERLPSFYTADEIRCILNAVDRSTPWGKTIYLMMLLACVYGLRSSDIKALKFDCIKWSQRKITISQFKTHREVSLPITDEILFALLDYIKNARPKTDNPNVFIRLRKPYAPYSQHDHFGDKIAPYFAIAGMCTEGKHHGLHSLRHSLATNLLATGTPVNEIAVILGHTSAASTKTYVWSDIEHLKIAALEVPVND